MLLKQTKVKKIIEKTFLALGTINHIKIFDGGKENAIEEVVERVLEIDDRMSAFKPQSDISKLTRNAGQGFQEVHKDTFELIHKATQFGDLSNGAFDITIRPLVQLWGIGKKGDFVPTDSEIQEVLKLVNYRDIELDPKTLTIALKRSGQALDLGGIAKGFAADEVKRILLESSVKSALINLGGNVMTIGHKPDGQSWQIGIQNPLAPTGQYLGVLRAVNQTIVTSGSNEQFFIKDSVRYHHILDPRTGRPAQSSLLSVTAVCTCSVDADALTTALFILGPEKGLLLLSKVKAEAIFIKNDLSVMVSPGLTSLYKS